MTNVLEPVTEARHAEAPASDGLRLDGVSKTWGDLKVLDDVSLDIGAGEVVWLRGRNGVGKTTLMRIAAGLILPEAGHVTAHGLDPFADRRAYQQHVSMLSAGDRGLYARLTVDQHLRFWSRMTMLPKVRRGPAIDAVVESFFLQDLRRRRVDRMSMGQRQRVRLAMAVLHAPRVVLFDEPLNSLDDEGIAALVTWLDDHVAGGGCSLWVSPGIDREAYGFTTRLELRDGKLAAA